MSGHTVKHGPYLTEQQASNEVDWETAALYADRSKFNWDRLTFACAMSRISLGDYDKSMLSWLANWEPQLVQVFVDLIERAYANGITVGAKEVKR